MDTILNRLGNHETVSNLVHNKLYIDSMLTITVSARPSAKNR
jgi:hypothetical protein